MENEFDNYIRIPKIPGYQELLDEMQGVAKEATLVSGITEVLENIGNLSDIIEAINGDTVDNIVDEYLDDEADQIEDIIGDWSENESE